MGLVQIHQIGFNATHVDRKLTVLKIVPRHNVCASLYEVGVAPCAFRAVTCVDQDSDWLI